MKEVYNKLFSKSYNNKRNNYHASLPEWAEKIEGKILDAGSGRGHASKMLIEAGREVFAIEFSDVCCERFLKDIPHECIDIVSYCKRNIKYGGVVCLGVLEHIPYKDIDAVIEGLANTADFALYAIANHSDIRIDTELHIIQEDENWWTNKLTHFYKECELVFNGKKLYIYECSRRPTD